MQIKDEMKLSSWATALPQHAGSSVVLNWFEFSYSVLQFVAWNSLSLRQLMVRELWSQRQPWEGFFKRLLALFPHLPETDSAATRSELGWLAVAPRTISWKLDVNLDYAHGAYMCVPAGVDIYSRSIFRKLDFSLKNKKPSLLVTLPDSKEK